MRDCSPALIVQLSSDMTQPSPRLDRGSAVLEQSDFVQLLKLNDEVPVFASEPVRSKTVAATFSCHTNLVVDTAFDGFVDLVDGLWDCNSFGSVGKPDIPRRDCLFPALRSLDDELNIRFRKTGRQGRVMDPAHDDENNGPNAQNGEDEGNGLVQQRTRVELSSRALTV